MKVRRQRSLPGWAIAALVVAVVIVCFVPVLANDFVLWDDDLNFTDNPSYRGLSWPHLRWMFTTVLGGHYQPLSWVTLGLDYTLWGLDPTGYHLTSLLLHAANAVLCYHLVRALLARAFERASAPGPGAAAAGALFFAIHPLRVESVAWASERRDVLSGLFYLATVLAYVRMAAAERTGGARRWYLVSLACFVLSLLSKAWGMTLPIVLVLLDVYPLRRPPRLLQKAPYAVLALGAAALAFLAQAQVPAMRTLAEHGPVERAAQAAYGLCFYLWKTLVPRRLDPAYLLEGRLDPTAPRYVLSFLAVTAITAAALLARRRRPWATVAWASYAVIVSPLTFRQARVWRDSRALWDHTLALDPTNWTAYTNRGVARQARGDIDGALADYDMALRYNPGHAEALNDRGIVRFLRGDVDGAIADYFAAIRVRPQYADAYENRGLARQAKGDVDGAMADYSAAIRLNPGYARAYYSRANLWLARGDADAAIADYGEAIRANPSYVEAYNNRAAARRAKGDVDGAIADYTRALEVAPGDTDRAMIRRNLDAARAERASAGTRADHGVGSRLARSGRRRASAARCSAASAYRPCCQ